MSRDLLRQVLTGLRALAVLTVVLGIAYPVAIWGIGQTVFPEQSNSSLIMKDGQVIGSRLMGQSFEGDQWFMPRPSAGNYDGLATGASNLGPSDQTLIKEIQDRRADIAAREQVDPALVPADAVTASGSGLDPDISPAYAEIQVARVAAANGLSVDAVRTLVAENTHGRILGFLGEPGVNVLELNLAIDQA